MNQHMHKVAMAGAVVLLFTGCDSVSGSPVAESSTATDSGNVLFEPCNIPEDALRAAKVDPTVVSSTFADGDDPAWDVCKWSGSWYFLTVLSTTHSFDELKSNPTSTDLKDVSVRDREAVSYTSTAYAAGLTCDVAFPWQKGSVVVRASQKASQVAQGDLCVVANQAANTLSDTLPR